MDATFCIGATTLTKNKNTFDVGAFTPNLNKRLPCFWAHDTKKLVGFWDNLRIDGDRLIADLELANTQWGESVRNALHDETIDGELGASISYTGNGKANAHGGTHYTKLNIHECSVTLLPSQPRAKLIKLYKNPIVKNQPKDTTPSTTVRTPIMEPCHKVTASVLARMKAETSLIDASFNLIELPPVVHKHSTPGEILLAMQGASPSSTYHSVQHAVKRILIRVGKTYKECRKELFEARKNGVRFLEMVGYLKDLNPLPDDFPTEIELLARQLKHGIKAGVIEPAIAEEMEKYIMSGLAYIDEETHRLEGVKSAADIAIRKQAHLVYKALSNHQGFNAYTQGRFKSLADAFMRLKERANKRHKETFYPKPRRAA